MFINKKNVNNNSNTHVASHIPHQDEPPAEKSGGYLRIGNAEKLRIIAVFKLYKVKHTNTLQSKRKYWKIANVDGNNLVHTSIKFFRHHKCSKFKDKRSQKKTSKAT